MSEEIYECAFGEKVTGKLLLGDISLQLSANAGRSIIAPTLES